MKILVVILTLPILITCALVGIFFGVCVVGFTSGMTIIREILKSVQDDLEKSL